MDVWYLHWLVSAIIAEEIPSQGDCTAYLFIVVPLSSCLAKVLILLEASFSKVEIFSLQLPQSNTKSFATRRCQYVEAAEDMQNAMLANVLQN